MDGLDEHAVADHLRALHRDASLWRLETDTGQFSLGGAQPKTALYFDGQRWGIPSGRLATTHILKPGSEHLAGHAENEHFCLELARALGLPVASSTIEGFEDQIGGKYRVHEIGVYAWDKLAKELGRKPEEVHGIIRALCAAMPDAASTTLSRSRSSGLAHRVLDEITTRVQARARACAALFD